MHHIFFKQKTMQAAVFCFLAHVNEDTALRTACGVRCYACVCHSLCRADLQPFSTRSVSLITSESGRWQSRHSVDVVAAKRPNSKLLCGNSWAVQVRISVESSTVASAAGICKFVVHTMNALCVSRRKRTPLGGKSLLCHTWLINNRLIWHIDQSSQAGPCCCTHLQLVWAQATGNKKSAGSSVGAHSETNNGFLLEKSVCQPIRGCYSIF
jgi:hypothetical protein